MAGKIVGITIDIAGKTSGLVSSLKSADSALSKTNSALKSVNSALKFDSSNVSLLTSKSQLLGEAIAQNSEKLDVLKATAEKAMETLGQEGGTTTEQFAELQAEISRTEQTLAGLETEAANTDAALSGIGSDAAGDLDDLAGAADDAAGAMDGMDEAGGNVTQSLGEIASKCQEVGEKLKTHVTDPLSKLGKASISSFKEVDSGMDIIVKKVGTIAVDLDDLQQVYENVFGSMPVSAEDAGNAVGEINTRMNLTGQELEDMTRLFLKFSNVTGADVSGAVASVDKIMEKFGDDAGSASDILNAMAHVSQRTGVSIDTLTGNLESNGAALKEMGFNVNESIDLLSIMEQNGVDVSTAMAGMKKAVQNATKEGVPAREALQDMITKIQNAQSEIGAMQYATELFGAKGAPEMVQAVKEERFYIDEVGFSMRDYGNIVNDTFEATQSAPDEAKVAFNNLKLAGAELGASILTVLSPAIKGLTSFVKDLTSWYKNLDPSVQKVITVIGLLAVTVGPLLIVLAKLITAIQVITTVIPACKAAVLALNAAFAANPIGLVITAIAALVAAFVYLWNNCEEFREFWIGLWEALQEGAGVVIDGIKLAFEQLGEGFQTVGDGIMLLFGTIGEAFGSLGDIMGTICSTALEGFQAFGDGVQTVFSTMWDFIKGIINTIIGGINGLIYGVESAINFVIRGMNKLHWEIPSWVPGLGGYGFGFDISEVSFGRIPELAQGAVIPPNNPFLAMLGDQRSGVNIEAPLATIQDALISALNSPKAAAATGPVYVTAYFGNERFGTVVAQANAQNAYISGGR